MRDVRCEMWEEDEKSTVLGFYRCDVLPASIEDVIFTVTCYALRNDQDDDDDEYNLKLTKRWESSGDAC